MDRLIAAAKCLKDRGAYKIYAVATHGIFSDTAPEDLEASPIDEVGSAHNKLESWLSILPLYTHAHAHAW